MKYSKSFVTKIVVKGSLAAVNLNSHLEKILKDEHKFQDDLNFSVFMSRFVLCLDGYLLTLFESLKENKEFQYFHDLYYSELGLTISQYLEEYTQKMKSLNEQLMSIDWVIDNRVQIISKFISMVKISDKWSKYYE